MNALTRYADAFGVDRGRFGCWRYIYADRGHGRPGRCPGEVWWVGVYETGGLRRRVWSCEEHLDGGENWTRRPARATAHHPDVAGERSR